MPRTLALGDRIIDASNFQEPVNLYYPGDNLFTPFMRRRGLPIGNLTSQFLPMYIWMAWTTSAKKYYEPKAMCAMSMILRYSTTIPNNLGSGVIVSPIFCRVVGCVCIRKKTEIVKTKTPTIFLGFVLLPGGYRRLPEANVRRFRNRLRGMRDRWRQGYITREEVVARVCAWIAHADHANTWRLRHAIFRGRVV